jgi:endonuclease/exonuclease/phosphatase (EEP) superfamily protein YafD
MIRLLRIAAFATAAFSLLTLLDQLHRLLELFSHFRAQYFVVAAVLGITFLALRDRGWAIGMLALTALNAVWIAPWYLSPDRHTVSDASTIKVLHANVYGRNDQYQRFLTLLEAEQPDLFFVQEMSAGMQTALQVVHADYPYRDVIVRNDNFGIAVYSRMPLDSVLRHESPPDALPSLLVATRVDGRPITFLSTHPMPPIGRSGFDSRNEQLHDIGALANSVARPIILIGDLNISMWAAHYRLLLTQTGLRNARQGFGLLPSWPAQLPFAMIPIDHCLVSGDVDIIDIRTSPAIGSDHLPLIVTLALQDGR